MHEKWYTLASEIFAQSDRPYIENEIQIDLCEVFRKELVRGSIFKNKYRTLKLEDVSQVVLGRGKYGSGAISGGNVHALTIDQQKQYMCYKTHSLRWTYQRLTTDR
jgi:hypothetical protein